LIPQTPHSYSLLRVVLTIIASLSMMTTYLFGAG
jgi:hypothetical protein